MHLGFKEPSSTNSNTFVGLNIGQRPIFLDRIVDEIDRKSARVASNFDELASLKLNRTIVDIYN